MSDVTQPIEPDHGDADARQGPAARTDVARGPAVALVAWPVLVWAAMHLGGPRTAAATMLCGVALLGAAALWQGTRSRAGALVPAALLALLALSTGSERFLFVQPILVNLAIAAAFGWSLRPGAVPLCEVFARRIGELPPGGAAHCRTFTWLWFGFSSLNAVVSAWLAARATADAWALWTGPGSYAAIAALIAGEVCVRRLRFGPTVRRSSARVTADGDVGERAGAERTGRG